MKANNLNYLLVNSTNEYLVEYNTLEENSRYKLTNFTGSAGEALVTPETIFLFVDGRYHIQADLEVDHNIITVIKLQQGQKYLEELVKRIPQDQILGIFSKKNSQKKVEEIIQKRKVLLLDEDPFDNSKTQNNERNNLKLDKKLCGLTSEEKISKISDTLSDDEVMYITDLDEVSYLFNMRNFSKPFSSKIIAKAIISKNKAILFTQKEKEQLESTLKNLKQKVYIDKNSINAYDYKLLGERSIPFRTNPVKLMKSHKTEEELEHLQQAFAKTDRALCATRDFIYNNDNITEYDIACTLEEEFKKQGAMGLSFNSIIAKDANSALAHYSKSSKDEMIKDGSLILIDCGAYFEGGLATDITRVFVKGEPTQIHKKIYTYVLKAFLRGYNYGNTHTHRPLSGFEIDKYVRDYLNSIDSDGFIFNHGLGHGIGINVHEYPPSLSNGELAKVPITEGACFTIEPGLYKEGHFGIRLENSCYYKNGNIHSFVKMNYEKKLIDYRMLNDEEKIWLSEFEVK